MTLPQENYLSTELTAFKHASNYYAAILSHFAPYLGSDVVEVGAGIGTFSKYLLNCGQVTNLTLIEPASNLFPILRKQFAANAKIRILNGHFESAFKSLTCSSAVLINVLEHVRYDENLLRTILQSLTPGGTLLLFVPALPRLYGSLDQTFGHFRRYTKTELSSLLNRVGFQVVSLRYFNILGIVPWFFAGKVFRRKSIDPFSVWLYDRLFMSWIPRFERAWEPTVGQSLIAVAKT